MVVAAVDEEVVVVVVDLENSKPVHRNESFRWEFSTIRARTIWCAKFRLTMCPISMHRFFSRTRNKLARLMRFSERCAITR